MRKKAHQGSEFLCLAKVVKGSCHHFALQPPAKGKVPQSQFQDPRKIRICREQEN